MANSNARIRASANELASIPIRNGFEFIVGGFHDPCSSFIEGLLPPKRFESALLARRPTNFAFERIISTMTSAFPFVRSLRRHFN
jgi:hypothetical protein